MASSGRALAALCWAAAFAVWAHGAACGTGGACCAADEHSGDAGGGACAGHGGEEDSADAQSLLQLSRHQGARDRLDEDWLHGPSYDVIVVGGGLVGAAVASKVAEQAPSKKVLLIEAGPRPRSLPGRAPIEMSTFEAPAAWDSGKYKDWPGDFNDTILDRFSTPGNYGVLNCWSYGWGECNTLAWEPKDVAGKYQVRVLGGGASVNGALTQHPNANMFDGGPYEGWPAWPQGWRWADMEPYYERVAEAFHWTSTPSADGKHYLDNSGGAQLAEVLRSDAPCANGSASAPNCAYPGGMRRAPTKNPTQGTFGQPMVTAKNGVRQSTASVFLSEAIKLQNFEMRVDSQVTGILKAKGPFKQKAAGVTYKKGGSEHTALLSKGGLLVMSGGTFNTPRLLLQSGFTNSGMGKEVSDHPMTRVTYKIPPQWAMEAFSFNPPDKKDVAEYMAFHTGGLAQFGPILTGFIRDPSTAGTAENYDVEIFVSPTDSSDSMHIWFVLMRPTCYNGTLYLSGEGLKMNTSRNCDRDLQTLQYAQDLVKARMEAQKAPATCVANCGNVTKHTRFYDMNHWAGSCALGRCVSPKTLLVHGAENVAVADASLLPGQVWGHPAMTLEAIALRAAGIFASL